MLTERVNQRQAIILAANPGMHQHRAQFLAEQELTDNERGALRQEREASMRAWLAQEARKPHPGAPQHIVDIHIRNGWDID